MQSGHRHTDPPRLAEWLVERAIPHPKARLGLTGDLREAFATRSHRFGRLVGVLWYWRQACSAVTRYALERRGAVKRHGVGRDPPLHSPFTRRRRQRMANTMQDLRYALRTLAKAPGIAALSIVALTLGIGTPTIMFTVINGVFRDLPVEQPERIARLFLVNPEGGQRWDVNHHDYAAWSEQQTSFDALAGFSSEDVTLSGGDARPLRRNAAFITPNAFDVLRIRPVLGRAFLAEDARPGATPVALVSHRVWQSRFAGADDIVGRSMVIDGVSHTVVGVMPQRFGFPENEELWLPLALSLDSPRADSPGLQVFGRLAAGVSIEQARLELGAIAARLAGEYPETNRDLGAGAAPYRDGLIDESFARGLYTMLAAVSFVLLIACVNVANLLLARAISRGREIAVRSALGASRGRVVSQFFIESFALAAVGGVLGTAVAWVGVGMFNRTLTSVIGLAWVDIRIDGTVLLFVLGVVLAGSLLAGVLPALQASSVDVNSALKDAPRGDAGPGRRIGRFGKSLVVVEIALSCALLVVSGLLIKGVLELRAIDLGMPVAEMVTGEVELPRQVYPTAESRIAFFEELETTVGSLPGATAALMSDIPGTIGFRMPVTVAGLASGEERTPPVGILTVSPSFLNVLGADILDGRPFTSHDRLGSEPVVLVNRRFAAEVFPDRRAIGRSVDVFGTRRTIVGVVPDLFMGNLEEPDANGPGIYMPHAQSGYVSMQLFVRTAGDPLALIAQIRDALESLDPTLALMEVDRVDNLIANETAVFAVFGRLFLFFGLVALFLASIGLYGVMSVTVRQRSREWGVRLALGAKARDVVRLATRQAAMQLIVGLSIGLAIAGALSRPLASFFYQVEPWDRTIFAATSLLLAVTGVLAALGPARRATRVDPLVALRDE